LFRWPGTFLEESFLLFALSGAAPESACNFWRNQSVVCLLWC
jgi:hypothetical protein